jgi:hypothetical protein
LSWRYDPTKGVPYELSFSNFVPWVRGAYRDILAVVYGSVFQRYFVSRSGGAAHRIGVLSVHVHIATILLAENNVSAANIPLAENNVSTASIPLTFNTILLASREMEP